MTESVPSHTEREIDQASVPEEERFTNAWLSELLCGIEQEAEGEAWRRLIKQCAAVHFRQLRMEETTARFHGDLDGFLDFLRQAWGWEITYQPGKASILVDENKNFCVCPLVRRSTEAMSPLLCNCSEGFAERMFSGVLGHPVSAHVIHSVLRGDPTCVYLIQF